MQLDAEVSPPAFVLSPSYLTRLVQSRRQILEKRSSVTAAAAGACQIQHAHISTPSQITVDCKSVH